MFRGTRAVYSRPSASCHHALSGLVWSIFSWLSACCTSMLLGLYVPLLSFYGSSTGRGSVWLGTRRIAMLCFIEKNLSQCDYVRQSQEGNILHMECIELLCNLCLWLLVKAQYISFKLATAYICYFGETSGQLAIGRGGEEELCRAKLLWCKC